MAHENGHNLFTNDWVHCNILFMVSIEMKKSLREEVLKMLLNALLIGIHFAGSDSLKAEVLKIAS